MPGAGKSLFVDVAEELGYVKVTMGDVIREETRKRGLELTPQNVGKVMLELRKEGGNNIIAEKCVPKILQQASSKIVIDGIRSLNEAEVFQANFEGFKLSMCMRPRGCLWLKVSVAEKVLTRKL
jgi:dephospho-CoA kinase